MRRRPVRNRKFVTFLELEGRILPTLSLNLSLPTDGFQGVAGQQRTIGITANDSVPADQAGTFNYSIQWGDGLTDNLPGSSHFTANHIYANSGPFTVSVTATDQDNTTSPAATEQLTILSAEDQAGILAVGAGAGVFTYVFTAGASQGTVGVTANNVALGTFTPSASQAFVYGQGNSNSIVMNGSSSADSFSINSTSVTGIGITLAGNNITSWQVNGQGGDDIFQIQSIALPMIIDGGIGVNQLNGPAASTSFSIVGKNAGLIGNAFAFVNIPILTGGAGDDTFILQANASLDNHLDGGAGNNTIDYTGFNSRVVVDLATQAVTAVRNLGSNGVSNIQTFKGSNVSTNLLVGPTTNSTWNLTAANAGTLVNAGVTTAFTAFPSLTGKQGNDVFKFAAGAKLDGTLDGGLGANTLDYSSFSSRVLISLGSNAATAINALQGGSLFDIQSIIGSNNLNNLLVGPNATTTWQVNDINAGTVSDSVVPGGLVTFSSFGFLTGGTGADSFQFSNNGSITGGLDGGSSGANNTLDYSSLPGRIVVSLSAYAATGINFLSSSSVYDIQNYIGNNTSTNLFVGLNANTTWNLTAANAGNLNGTTSFSSFRNLTGGSGNDVFKIGSNGSLAGSVDGGAGTNTLDYSSYGARVVVSLGAGSGAATGFFNLSSGGIVDFQSIIGSAIASNLLVGPNSDVTWNLNGANAGNITPTLVGTVTFSSFAFLTGGTGADTFKFLPNGNVSGGIDGGSSGSANTLDYTGFLGNIVVSLGGSAATGVHGLSSSSVYDFQHYLGNANIGNIFVGSDNSNVWNVTANNSGNVNGVTFSSFPNLVGGANNDDFILTNAISITGSLDAKAGSNTLDYSAWNTAIAVNLSTGVATHIGSLFGVQNVLGGSGNDSLTGASSGGFLVGGAGVDTIVGGSGRSLLIGGLGNDTVTGRSNGDLIIAGSTNFDSNPTALLAILAEWQANDTYANRVSALRAGTGLAQGNKLVSGSTVINDAGVNALVGDGSAPIVGELDWFFANLAAGHDTINNNSEAGELVN